MLAHRILSCLKLSETVIQDLDLIKDLILVLQSLLELLIVY